MKKRKSFILFILLISLNLFGQNGLKKVDIDKNYKLYESSLDDFAKYYFRLIDIKNSNYKIHFRYLKNSQAIDIYSNDNINFEGEILNFITEQKAVKVNDVNSTTPNKYVYEILKLDNKTSNEIGKDILNSNLQKIPDYKEIKNWNRNWLDCGSISFILKINSNINEKDFSCPSQQNDSIDHVKSLKLIYHKIDNNDSIKNKFDEFKNKLEKGKTYSNGFVQMYLFTNEESENWNKSKPKREYLKSIKDTITNFLDVKVNELIKNTNDLDCFDDYYLVFSEKGKLLDVKIRVKLDKEERKCIKLIKKRLKNIKIDLVNPMYPFERVLSFYKKKPSIYDNTIY
jgi:hypothetical protein